MERIWTKLFSSSHLMIIHIKLYSINFIYTFTLMSRMSMSFSLHPKGNHGGTPLHWSCTWSREPGFHPYKEPDSDLTNRGSENYDPMTSSQLNLTSKAQRQKMHSASDQSFSSSFTGSNVARFASMTSTKVLNLSYLPSQALTIP
jgi:hypothetical protein